MKWFSFMDGGIGRRFSGPAFVKIESTNARIALQSCTANTIANAVSKPGGSVRGERANFTRLVLGWLAGKPDYLHKLKVPEGYEKINGYSNI